MSEDSYLEVPCVCICKHSQTDGKQENNRDMVACFRQFAVFIYVLIGFLCFSICLDGCCDNVGSGIRTLNRSVREISKGNLKILVIRALQHCEEKLYCRFNCFKSATKEVAYLPLLIHFLRSEPDYSVYAKVALQAVHQKPKFIAEH